jgi:DNA-binding HxlR family transcriptional regulator
VPKRYGQACPVAKSLEVVGDRWTLLLVRDLLSGPRRFQDLQQSLAGIPPNILSDRLKLMEEHALMARSFYSDHPPRAEYALTEKGRELGVVVGRVGLASPPPADGVGARRVRPPGGDQVFLPPMRRPRPRRHGGAAPTVEVGRAATGD